jgi:predicted RNase H-like HicB family nuclease
MLNQTFNSLIWKEDKYFIAKCLEVEVASQGKTKREALANLKEALSLYFEDEKVGDSILIEQPQLVTVTIKA